MEFVIIIKKINNTLTEQEREIFEEWYHESDSHREFFENVRENYMLSSSVTIDKDKSWSDLKKRLRPEAFKDRSSGMGNVSVFRTFPLRVAASILIAGILLSFLVQSVLFEENEEIISKQQIVDNPRGVRTQTTMPDGTEVWLNSDSQLEYLGILKDSIRLLKLDGEAFFKVAKNKRFPFVVVSNGMLVRALGTEFNLRSYRDDNEVVVALTEGKIAVSHEEQSSSLLVAPGETVVCIKRDKKLMKVDRDHSKIIGWKDGRIVFNKASMSEVIGTLERWYDVDIQLMNSDVSGQWTYTSEFENEGLDIVLQNIGYVKDFNFDIHEKVVRVEFLNRTEEK